LLIVFAGYLYSETIPSYSEPLGDEYLARARVLSVTDSEYVEGPLNSTSQIAVVEITEGEFAGRVLETVHYKSGNLAYDFDVYPGDNVVLNLVIEGEELVAANIAFLDRELTLKFLFWMFIAVILLIGAWKGLKTVLTLSLTGLGIVKILIPSILVGKDPVAVTIIVTSGVTFITFLLISGLNRKALAAIMGTVLGTLSAALIAHLAISATRLSQLAVEEGGMLLSLPQSGVINFQGLLLAGIIIGALGAVMDMTMSISSTMYEVKVLNPGLSGWQLMKSGMNVGRDVIGTMASTLILAYTGEALPLLVIIVGYQIPLIKVLNLDLFAIEIVRTLAGSIGLFLAVPLTAAIGGLLHSYPWTRDKKSQNIVPTE